MKIVRITDSLVTLLLHFITDKILPMIVHIFNGSQIHLVSTIAKGFITTYLDVADPFILIYGGSNENRKKYENLFQSHRFANYMFLDSLRGLCEFVLTKRSESFLFHSGKYAWFATVLLCGAKNVNWVCWGNGSAIGNNWKSKLITPVKKYIYRRFSSIVTLMDEDKVTLIRDFGVKKENIQTISYATLGKTSVYDSLYQNLLEEQRPSNTKPLILLGNSPREMKNYIKMLQILAHLKGKIRVQCMNNYSLKRGERYEQLIALGKETFGEDFRSNEEFYSERDAYIKYMNTCDVYICSSNTQTGLGAIQTCLQLGKKVYIHGKNLSWIRNHYGVLVFDTDNITNSTTFEDLVRPLNLEQKRENQALLFKEREINVNSWNSYLSILDAKP